MTEAIVSGTGLKDLNHATIHVLQAALERKVITATEIATLIPRGIERDPDKFSAMVQFIRKTLADHRVQLVADRGSAAHLKQHPIVLAKKGREFQSFRAPDSPNREHEEIEKQIEYVKDRGEDYEYDILKMYYRDVYRYRLLSPEEEVGLCKRILEGDLDARNTLVKHNLRLVRWVASRWFHWSEMPFEDLLQEGNLGLITAAEKFDYRLGYRFTTYAQWWIRQAIGIAIKNKGAVIRVPVHILETINKVRKTQRQIERETGKEASEQEIAQRMELSRKMVRKALSMYALMSDPISMDEELGTSRSGRDNPTTFGELLPDTTSLGPEMYLEALEELTLAKVRLEKTITSVVDQIGVSERNIEVFKHFYGLGSGGIRKTLEATAEQFDITRERIRQIIASIWEKVDEVGGNMDHREFVKELFRIEELEKIVLSAQ